MISSELLAILVCPQNRTPLRLAEPTLVDRLNQAVADRQLKNKSGETVERTIEEGLIREDGAYLYPVFDGIPILLADESIPLSHAN